MFSEAKFPKFTLPNWYLLMTHKWIFNRWRSGHTVFTRLDATATIYFIARVCDYSRVAFTNRVAVREVIHRETVDWYRWTRSLCWCRLKLVLGLYRYFSCTCYREWVARHVHVLRASRIVGVAQRLFKSGDYFIQYFRKWATIWEQRLIERIRCYIYKWDRHTMFILHFVMDYMVHHITSPVYVHYKPHPSCSSWAKNIVNAWLPYTNMGKHLKCDKFNSKVWIKILLPGVIHSACLCLCE